MTERDKEADKRVQEGIKFLNERKPDWRKDVNKNLLALHRNCNCPLGQIFGGFDIAINQLRISYYDARDLGFDSDKVIGFVHLQKAWEKALDELESEEVGEIQVYEIIGFTKEDNRYDVRVNYKGERVILKKGEWVGPYWQGYTRNLSRGVTQCNNGVLLKRAEEE